MEVSNLIWGDLACKFDFVKNMQETWHTVTAWKLLQHVQSACEGKQQ